MRGWWIALVLCLAVGSSHPALAEDAATGGAKGQTLEQLEKLEGEAAGATEAPAAEPLTKAKAAAVDPKGAAPLDDPLTCLARTIYWEAKGEDVAVMEGVANVVMNRLADGSYPQTICEVVTQGEDGGPCQFSWWCDGSSDQVEEPDRYAITTEVARRALNQELADRTDGALFFHGSADTPDWAAKMTKTATVGDLVFYRPKGTGGG